MSVLQGFICEKFREVAAEFSSLNELFRSSYIVVSPDTSYVALGVEKTLYIFGTAKPDERSNIISGKHKLSIPIKSVFSVCIIKDSEAMDVVFVGTTDGHVLCIHVDGITLFEMHLGSEPIRSVQLHTETDSQQQQLAVLCGSTIICVQWDDLVHVLFKSHAIMLNTYLTRPNSDWTTNELHLRYEVYNLPVENRNFQFMCSDPIPLGLFNYSVKKAIKSPDDPDSQNVLAMPVQTLWAVTGEKPFVTFNVSGKIASSLTSLLYAEAKRMIWGSKSTNKNVVTVRFAIDPDGPITPSASLKSGKVTSLELFRALADQRRQVRASGMVTSSDRQWIALTDNLGRVLLIDAQRERVARVWKGYRDAEVAFFDVTESPSHHRSTAYSSRYPTAHTRRTRCLFIHAPHLRILEVWRLVHGPRLTTWDVDEPVRLIPAQSQMIGAFGRQSSVQESTDPFQAFLLDSKGTLYTLSVSPELCLAETDAEAVLGYHEFQVMQACHTYLDQLHSIGPVAVIEQLLKQFAQFKTASWFEQALIRAIHHLHQTPHLLTDLVYECITLLAQREKDQDDGNVSAEFGRLHAQLSKMHSLMQFYKSIVSVNNACLNEQSHTDQTDSSDAWMTESESIADLLNWDVEDTERCLKVYALCARILRPGSHLRLAKTIGIHAFIDCFKYLIDSGGKHYQRHGSSDSADPTASDRGCPIVVHVTLTPQDSLMRLSKLGSMIFGPYLLGKQPYDALLNQLSANVLTPDILLYTLTSYILRWECFHHLPTLIRRMHRIYANLLARFCESDCGIHRLDTSHWPDSLSVPPDIMPLDTEQSHPSTSRFGHLWNELFQFVVASAQISSAYLLSLVFRSLLYHAWQSADQGQDILCSWRACAKFESPPLDSATGEFLGFDQSTSFEGKESKRSLDTVPVDHPPAAVVPFDTTGELEEKTQPVTTVTLNNLVNQWHDLCSRFEDLFYLGLLVQLPATDSHELKEDRSLPTHGFPVTMRRVLTCGRACLTEVFASWLVRWRMQSDQLITFYQGMCDLTQSISGDETKELALNNAADLRRALFPIVYKRLPFTLELDVVIASVCWMHYQRWLSEPKALTHLHQCIEFLRRLSSAGAIIAQGMGRLIWQGDLRLWYGKCMNATRTTQQTRSRHPVDKHLKELSILIMRFFSVYSHACEKAEVVPIFSIEHQWTGLQNHHTWKSDVSRDLRSQSEEPASYSIDPTPLAVLRSNTAMNLSYTLAAEVAVNQSHPPPQSVASWEQAVIVVAAMCTFSCPRKSTRRSPVPGEETARFYQVSDFFPTQDAPFITERFNPDWVSKSASMEPDGSLDNRRRLFISWLIDRAVQSYRNSLEASNPLASRRSERRSVSPSDSWSIEESSSSRLIHTTPGRYSTSVLDIYTLFTTAAGTLARYWGFPRDMALSQHVLALFEANLDDQAELYLSQIQDTATLATRLLLVVGRRVAWQCFGVRKPEANPYQLRWRACIPFDLESWLRGLLSDIPSDNPALENPSEMFDPSTELTRLVRLIDFILNQIPSQASQLHVAEALRDTIYAMHEAD